ncbi:asparagine synthase (glutamine-hydrolyzing) [Streptomyces sp. NPDC003717]|uniref:asparagine synthase (glutamine-hydrolyzing) n=1 Tax=Streptomyces sp. NPDC003717 TaxID=3154276 RepID=UPI0033B36480
MCGIAGAFALDGAAPHPGHVAAMAAELAHRGPDSAGSFADGPVALGFRRLALIDPEGGRQPHTNADGSVVSVCNGEIFNHRALRDRLRRAGHRFRSRCDTEVLVHLYEEYGPDLVDHLDGQFAFALYDRRERRLLLCRDRCGVIPLFHTRADGHLVFASEIKGLLRYPGVARRVDLGGLDQVLSLPGLVSPRTLFEGIASVAPGELITVDPSGVATRRYWDLDYPMAADLEHAADAGTDDDEIALDHHAGRVRRLLEESVEARLDSDLPVGFYLSGGLDSSLIGGLMAGARPEHAWPSYSVAFPGGAFDEAGHQRLVAGKLGTRHHEVRLDERIAADTLRTMVRHAETPVRESYNVCSYLLSRRVRASGTRAVLSGEGADELFGGYPGYRFDAGGPPAGGGSPSGLLEEQLEREANHRMFGLDLRYEQDQVAALDRRRPLYAPDLAAGLDTFAVTAQTLVDPARLTGRHPLHQRSYLDFRLRLSDHLLGDHGDRMALANSVEMRFPFLARDVVEYATRIPPSLMVRGGREKAVLHRAADGLVPPEVLRRQKFGFRGHTSTDLLGSDWFAELLSPSVVRRQGYFDPATVSALVERQRSGSRQVHPHLDTDYLMVAATFALFVEEFELPCLG